MKLSTSMRSVAALATLAFAAATPAIAAWEPTKTVEFIVPAGTGGGADQMARLIQSIVAKNNLMKQPMVVINKGGGAGAEGFLDVKGASKDPHKIIITIGAALIGFVAGEMAWEDHAIAAWTSPYSTNMKYAAATIGAIFVVALGQWIARRQARAPGETPANPAQ